jgi:hypothetical protein
MANAKIEWVSVDADTLPVDLRTKYENYMAAQKSANELRKEFENAFKASATKKPPAGKEFVFSYRFGLGFGLADAKKPSTSGKKSIADFFK